MTLENAHLYAILDTSYIAAEDFALYAEKLIKGGVDLLQIRAKYESADDRRALVRSVLDVCTDANIPLILNDDVEVASEFDGLGLHVGQDDLNPEIAREMMGPDRIIGLSTHSREQATAAYEYYQKGIVNYFAVGPVFKTPTKPDYTPVTLDLVSWVVENNFHAPHFFIGGINESTLPLLIGRGANRAVVVSALLKAIDVSAAASRIKTSLVA